MKSIYQQITSSRLGRAVLMLLLFLAAPDCSRAQRYPFFNIGIEQGLVQSQVFAITQDSAGHLWAGTFGGLSCFDGHTFRSFTVRDGLSSNYITTLCCDTKGRLWVGTKRGLNCYDGHSFRSFVFTAPDNPGGNIISQLSPSPDGTVWCTANNKLYHVVEGKVESIALPGGYKFISAILNLQSGPLLVGLPQTKSVFSYRNGSWDSTTLPPSPEETFILRMYEDVAHRPVFITSRGLYRITGASWDMLMPRKSPSDPLLYSFAEGRDGSYWISFMEGVTRIKDKEQRHFTKQNGLTDVLIYDMLTDKEGNIWMASNGEGLFRFSGAAFTAVDERMGLKGTQVSSIARDHRGIVYFGTYDGGLYRYQDSRATPMLFPGRISRPVTSLVMQSGTLWIGTTGIGLWSYNVASGAMKRYEDKRLGPAISSLVADENGLWITSNNSAAFLSRDSLKMLRIKSAQVEGVVMIGADSPILCTTEGLKLYRNDSIYSFITHSAADSAQIVCMAYRDGKLWLGSSDNGLFGYNLKSGKTTHISKRDGLRSDFIYNLYASPDGYVWVGTGYGICRIKPGKDRSDVTFYGRSAGITGMESNRNAVLPLEDGSIWFGTTGGALLYNPADAPASTMPVSIQLQRIQLFGESIKDTSWYKGTSPVYGVPLSLRLPWQQNNLTFTFSAISLMGDEGITYRYRVAGLNAPWSEWNPNNTVTFSALPPGQYVLEVQCSTDGLHPQPGVLQYTFEIITPFQKTTLFRLLLLGACILLGIAIQYALARRKRARLALIESLRREEQAKVRQRTAEDFHDEVGNKITRINVLTNVLRSKIGTPTPDATRIIDQIQDNAGQLYSGTRDILWSLQPSNDTLYQVLQRIREFGHDLFGDTEITFEMAGIDPLWKTYRMPMDASRNLIMIFKEALNNTLKYANADKVLIDTNVTSDILNLTITDDGEGFDESAVSRGQGLINMKTRAKRLGGTLDCSTAPGAGTTINLTLKIPLNKV